MAITDWNKLAPEHSRLVAFWGEARAAYTVTPIPDAAAREAYDNWLKALSRSISRLSKDGELGAGVIAGTVTPEKWASVANVTGNELVKLMSGLDEDNGITRLWKEVVVPTGESAAAAARFGFPLAVALVWGLVALYVVRAFK